MGWEAWLTVTTVVLMATGLVLNKAGPDIILLGGLTLLMTVGSLCGTDLLPTPAQAVEGFGNEGLITVGLMFVVAAGLSNTGAMSLITQPLLGRPKSVLGAQVRMMFPVAGMSAFLNNTPIVAMFIPVVNDWCKKTGLAATKLFIPLSYASILGGTCSLIGTSTNLVVYGMLDPTIQQSMGMFTIAAIGIPATLIGLAYIILVTPKLLPDRKRLVEDMADARRYTVEMLVEAGSVIDGRTIEQAGLRQLPGAFLMEIQRKGEDLPAVGPNQILHGDDRLIFVGVVDSVIDLQKIRGLAPATDQVFKLADPRAKRCLIEVVVSDSNPLIGKTIRQGRFRTVYNAVVIAVHRNGQHLKQKLGDIQVRAGDTLLLEARPRFVDDHRNSRDFFLVSEVAGSKLIRHDKARAALAILGAMVLLVSFGFMSMLNGVFIAAGLMVLTRCCTGHEARAAVDWRVLLTIGGALGIGHAITISQAAESIAGGMISLFAPMGPWGVLIAVYLIAMIFTETIGHIGAAVLVFPIAMAAAGPDGLNVSFMPFVITIMMAASASFATPIGYQTNLMVYGAGGYRFSDYVRIGLPLNLLIMAVVVTLVPTIWPF